MAGEYTPEPKSTDVFGSTNNGLSAEQCNAKIQRSLRTPMVKFLREHLEKAGCAVGENFIKAVHCDKEVGGGFTPGAGIRANHLSGDCHYKREFLRGYMKIRGHEQGCVKRRVMKSMMGNPRCSEEASRGAMEVAWDVCYNDTKPFDRAP